MPSSLAAEFTNPSASLSSLRPPPMPSSLIRDHPAIR